MLGSVLGGRAQTQLLLNEVLYDPVGADGGQEFVEIYNAGAMTVSLAGVRLQFANGAAAPDWQTRWTGGAADSVRAQSPFLIVDRGWEGSQAGNAEANLALQNGPDAIRLLRSDETADLLGYGALTDATLFEGEPAPDVPSGWSLGRRPDGHDTDHNVRDWRELSEPSPGRPNFAMRALEVDLFLCSPPSMPSPGFPVEIIVRVVNTGLADLHPGQAVLVEQAGAIRLQGWLDELSVDQGATLRFGWRPGSEGRCEFALELHDASGLSPLVVPAGQYQVGEADLYLNEVMAAPSSAGCEWVEVGNATDRTLSLEPYRLRDQDGSWRELPPVDLAAGQYCVLVQSRDRFLSWWEGLIRTGAPMPCDAAGVALAVSELPGGWPSLNNSAPPEREFADRVHLGDAAGTIIDHVTLGAEGSAVSNGRSLERVALRPRGSLARNWGPTTFSTGGTPACANSLSLTDPVAGEFHLQPNPFYPGGGAQDGVLHLRFELQDGHSGWDAGIFDLWGRSVRDLGGDRLGRGPRDVIWDGCDNRGTLVDPGGYIVLLRTYDVQGRLLRGTKRLAVVGSRNGQ